LSWSGTLVVGGAVGSGAADCVGVDHYYPGFGGAGRGDFWGNTVGLPAGLM